MLFGNTSVLGVSLLLGRVTTDDQCVWQLNNINMSQTGQESLFGHWVLKMLTASNFDQPGHYVNSTVVVTSPTVIHKWVFLLLQWQILTASIHRKTERPSWLDGWLHAYYTNSHSDILTASRIRHFHLMFSKCRESLNRHLYDVITMSQSGSNGQSCKHANGHVSLSNIVTFTHVWTCHSTTDMPMTISIFLFILVTSAVIRQI